VANTSGLMVPKQGSAFNFNLFIIGYYIRGSEPF